MSTAYGRKVDQSDIQSTSGGLKARFGPNPFILDTISYEVDEDSSSAYLYISGTVGERTFNTRIYEVTGYYNDNRELVNDMEHEETQKQLNLLNFYFHEFGCAFASEETYWQKQTQAVQNGEITSFKTFCEFLIKVVTESDTYKNSNPILFFANFQWVLKKERTYLEFPKIGAVKHGKCFCYIPEGYNTNFKKFLTDEEGNITSSEMVGNEIKTISKGRWEETDNPKTVTAMLKIGDKEHKITYTSNTSKVDFSNSRIGLFFVNNDGQMPPLTRNAWYASSNFANAQLAKTQEEEVSNELNEIDDIDLPE